MDDTPKAFPTVADYEAHLIRISRKTLKRSRRLIQETDALLKTLHLPR